jgi:chlorophyllide a reductase subunit Y
MLRAETGRQVRCWTSSPRTIPRDRTTSRNPCARPSARLRVGLRMKRTATVLSGSACCVYGLTFTSHFYGAQAHGRLCAVQLRNAGDRQAVRGHPRCGPRDGRSGTTTPSSSPIFCVPTASGVPLRLLPKEINGVRIVGIDVPGFGVPTHAEAKDVLAGAMLPMPAGGRAGPCPGAQRRRHPTSRPSRWWARCSPPIRW